MTQTRKSLKALKLAVKRAGSQSSYAKAMGVTQPSVWRWISVMKYLPAEYVLATERLYGVSRHDLRSDIYPVEESRKAVGA